MLFSTPEYIFLFLPFVVFVYFLLAKYPSVIFSKLWLIAASSYFYSFASSQHLLLLYTSIAVNFIIGKHLVKTGSPGCNKTKNVQRKILLISGITANVTFLAVYKYTDFLIYNFNYLADSNYSYLKMALPLAISFYTFQQISFLVDSYSTQIKERNFIDYCIYVMFFPQLIAGPVLRFWEISPQLKEQSNKTINWANISSGLFVFGIGLFKKVVIADSFAVFANAGFDTGSPLDFFQAWSTSLSYTFQLYYDFSGYSDMAIGTALMFNIKLPVNFNSPYKACNIQEFWQRWHITLSRWLRDYLYVPLGGNRKGPYRTLINLMLTFLLAGAWHGAGWTFIIWGGLHGGAMVIHRLWKKFDFALPGPVDWFLTFMFINFAWVFFRAQSVSDAFRILKGMFSFDGTVPTLVTNLLTFSNYGDQTAVLALNGPLIATTHAVFFILFVPLMTLIFPNSMQLVQFEDYDGKLYFKASLASALFLAAIVFISFLTFVGKVSPGNFIYFQF